MSETKHRYVVRMEAEGGKVVTAQLESMASGGKKSFDVIEGAATRVDSRFNLLTSTILTRMLPAFSVGAFGAAMGNAIKDLADLKDAADKVGISAEKLQVFRLLGEDVGIGAAASEDAIAKYVRSIGEAQAGTGKLLDTLKRYNIELKDSSGVNRDAFDILDDLADVISQVEDEQTQLSIAQKAFGDNGAAFVIALRNGSDGLEEFKQLAYDSGWIIDENLIKKADEFDQAWERAMHRWKAEWKSSALEAATAIEKIIQELNGMIQFGIHLRQMKSVAAQEAAGQMNIIPKGAFDGLQVPADTIEGRLQQRSDKIKKSGFPVSNGKLKIETRTKQEIDAANKAQEDAVKLAEKEAEKIREVVAALQFRNEQVMRNEQEQELYNQLKAAGVELSSKEGQQIQDLVGKYYDFSKAQEKVRQEMERNERVAKGFGDAVASSFSRAIVEGDSLSDVISGLGKDIERLLFKEFVGDPIAEGITGFIKDIIPFGGFKAEGGPLDQGKWYIAGEHGPEPVWGGGAGAFATGYPTSSSGGGQGGSNVTVNVINNSNASVEVKQSKNGNEQSIEVMVDQAMARAVNNPNSRTSRAMKAASAQKLIRR